MATELQNEIKPDEQLGISDPLNPNADATQQQAQTPPSDPFSTLTSNEVIVQNGLIRSGNFVTNSAGWRIQASGNAEFNDGTFRGTLTASSINIPDTTTANSFHVNSDGDAWWGATTLAAGVAWVKKDGSAKFASGTIGGWTLSTSTLSGGSITLDSVAGTIAADGNFWQLKGDGTTRGVGYLSSLLYPCETLTAGEAVCMTQTTFAAATTALNFGLSTGNQKNAFMTFGSGTSMTTMKMALKKTIAAIAYDATATATPADASTITWSHTCTGSNLILIVMIGDGQDSTTGVTYNGVAMTIVPNSSGGGGDNGGSMWYLVNPSTGANNIVASFSSFGLGYNKSGGSTSYKNCSSVQLDSYNTTSGSSSPITVATTVVASNCWTVGGAYAQTNTASNITINKTSRSAQNWTVSGTVYSVTLGDSNAIVGTGSQSITYTKTGTITNLAGTTISLTPFTINDNYIIRIETDSADAPSGTLAHANATATVAQSTLTTSFVDTTITFAGAFTLTGGVKYWLVAGRSGTLDDREYYSSGYLPSTSRLFAVNGYDGASWSQTASSVGYVRGYGFSWITKTQADLANSFDFFGFANEAITLGSIGSIASQGILSVLDNLTVGSIYYLSNTAGAIATSAGGNSVKVGKALAINQFLIIQPPL